MHRILASALILPALSLPLAAQDQDSGETGQAMAMEAQVALADGTSAGTVIFTETPDGVLIEARLENRPRGAITARREQSMATRTRVASMPATCRTSTSRPTARRRPTSSPRG